MRGQIVSAHIRFRFDDHAGCAAVHQDLTQQVARDLYRVALVEFARQRLGPGLQFRHRHPIHCAPQALHPKIKSSPMRLFTAIDLPPDIRARLDSLIDKLRPLARITWSRAANLHITTKFIGEWPEERLAELRTALAGVSPGEPISVSIQGLGFLPNRRSPRVFLACVDAPPALRALAKDIDSTLGKLGIEHERRTYSPHLTLARIKKVKGLSPFYKKVEELGDPEFGSFQADRFFLYQSKPGAAGSVYTKLSEFPISTQ